MIKRKGSTSSAWLWLGPMLFVTVIGAYLVFRYQGLWAENDSGTFTRVIQAMYEGGRLVPKTGEIYPNGYTFQALSVFLLAASGLEIPALQQLVYPLLAGLVVLPAWLLYRELTGSGRGAAIATLLIFTQPEFLFVVLRSSHEKFTRILMMLCIFFLVRSFSLAGRPGMLATTILLFYLSAFGFIASNALLAHSFIFAVLLALLLGLVMDRFTARAETRLAQQARLRYTVLISLIFSYIFTFYLYTPAQHDLLVLEGTRERVAALLLDVQAKSTNAYAYVDAAWISLPVYFLLTSANWIMLAASFVLWAAQGVRWLRHGVAPAGPAARLLWLLYAAFAFQGGLSVVVDASGALGANLQHRIFPSFSILGVAVVATALASWKPGQWRPIAQWSLAATIGLLACLSVMKATNEPALSNKWTFYEAEEMAALSWSDTNLRQAEVWTEFDERLQASWRTSTTSSAYQNRLRSGSLDPATRVLLMSDLTRLRSSRLGRPLPVPYDAQRIYDNGAAELYRLRPATPFQR